MAPNDLESRARLEAADDRELVAAVVAGHPHAWPVFSRRFERLIRACIRRTLRWYGAHLEESEIEDLLNAVFLNIIRDDYKRLRLFDPSRGYKLSSWVGLIATNAAIDALRRRGPEHVSIEREQEAGLGNVPASGMAPDEVLERKEEVELLAAAVERLSPEDRLFLEYYFQHDLEPTVIAERMNIAVATVYSKKNKVREKLKQLVHDLDRARAREDLAPVPVEPNG